MSKKETEIPDVLTFVQGRDLIADDMAEVAKQFTEAEKAVRDGDVEAAFRVISNMGRWSAMLMIRFDDRMERVEAGREPKKRKTRGCTPEEYSDATRGA